MRRKVLIAADVDPWLAKKLGEDERFLLTLQPSYSEAELLAATKDNEVLVTRYHNRVSDDVIRRASFLKLLVQGTSGLDNIDVSSAARHGLTVIGIPGENARAVAEYVVAVTLSLTRELPGFDRMVHTNRWDRSDCASRRELRSHRIGIVGLGRVGTAVARLVGMFGAGVTAYDPYITSEQAPERGARLLGDLHSLLAASDVISLHVPLTDETRGMIGAKELDLLPPGAVVINTCRGPVADIDALLERLRDRRLAGIALDVYDEEPPAFREWPDDPQLITTPHIAGCSRESKESIARRIYQEICGFYGIDPLT